MATSSQFASDSRSQSSTQIFISLLAAKTLATLEGHLSRSEFTAASYRTIRKDCTDVHAWRPVAGDLFRRALKDPCFSADICMRLPVLTASSFWSMFINDLISQQLFSLGGFGKVTCNGSPASILFEPASGLFECDSSMIVSFDVLIKPKSFKRIDDTIISFVNKLERNESVDYLSDWMLPLIANNLLTKTIVQLCEISLLDLTHSEILCYLQWTREPDDLLSIFSILMAYTSYLSWLASFSIAINYQSSLVIDGIGIFYAGDATIGFVADDRLTSLLAKSTVLTRAAGINE